MDTTGGCELTLMFLQPLQYGGRNLGKAYYSDLRPSANPKHFRTFVYV